MVLSRRFLRVAALGIVLALGLNNRISSLGLLTWWGDFRLEFPTILTISAKTAYPEKFKDVKVSEIVDQ